MKDSIWSTALAASFTLAVISAPISCSFPCGGAEDGESSDDEDDAGGRELSSNKLLEDDEAAIASIVQFQ